MTPPELRKLVVHSWNSELYGVGEWMGKPVHFPYVGLGDEIEYWKLGRGKRSWNKLFSRLPAQDNSTVPAKCSYFGICGGCRAQQIPYATQFALKTNSFLTYYKETWGIEVELIPAKEIWNYRNRMDFAVFPEAIGLRQEGNFRKIVDINHCSIQSERANAELVLMRDLISQSDLPYDRKQETGFLKYITLRTSSDHKELQTILTFIQDFSGTELEKIWEERILELSQADSLIFCYNRKQAEVSAMGNFKVLKGENFFHETVLGQDFEVPFDSFFQPNPKGFDPILKYIEKQLNNKQEKHLVDLYCGSGFFSLLFGNQFESLSGFDNIASSIERARTQIGRKFPEKSIRFEVKDLYSIREEFEILGKNASDTFVIVDPPRNGLGKELTDILRKSSVNAILYVSCNPHSQKKDLEEMSLVFVPESILITDPYPHTPHLESVLLLKRRK
jgi:tRNA (uracil-5-)-methyltransferase